MNKVKHPTDDSMTGKDLLKRLSGDFFKTGILKFDNLIGEAHNGCIVEIFGLPSTGKTMILYTIIINILEQTDNQIIFIDTKRDFQAKKLMKMMLSREIPQEKCRGILKRIQIHRCTTADHLIATLKFIVETPLQHEKLKFVMIDSMTVIWYLYLGHTLFRLKNMEEIMNLIKRLMDRNITVCHSNGN